MPEEIEYEEIRIGNVRGEKGEDGIAGAEGKTPEKGVDYFTESDIEEIVAAVLKAMPVETALAARMDGG